jgi:hypothetical protein
MSLGDSIACYNWIHKPEEHNVQQNKHYVACSHFYFFYNCFCVLNYIMIINIKIEWSDLTKSANQTCNFAVKWFCPVLLTTATLICIKYIAEGTEQRWSHYLLQQQANVESVNIIQVLSSSPAESLKHENVSFHSSVDKFHYMVFAEPGTEIAVFKQAQ